MIIVYMFLAAACGVASVDARRMWKRTGELLYRRYMWVFALCGLVMYLAILLP